MSFIYKLKYSNDATYKLTARRAFLDKLNRANSFTSSKLIGAKLYITLTRLDTFDSSRIIAALFILTLLSGCKPYIVRFGLFQTFHEKDYDAIIVVNLNKRKIYSFFETLSLGVVPFLPKADLRVHALKIGGGVVVQLAIADLSFIRVVETHSIFFKWYDSLSVSLTFDKPDLAEIKLFLSAYKFNTSLLNK